MGSPVSISRPHVVVIHRWRDSYAHYGDYLDHERYAVTYVTTEVGEPGVPAGAAEVLLVRATDDLPSVRRAVGQLASRHGAPSAVVALKEDDLLVAARLRAEWDCPGPSAAALLPFRDKYVMTQAIAARRLPVPAFAPAPDADAVRGFAAGHGWPVVLKPRIGSSSEGVILLDGPDELAAVDFGARSPSIVQVCDPNPIYHVDGLFQDGRTEVLRASRYLNTCLGFRTGDALGSVEEDDPEVLAAIGLWTPRFLAALSADPVVFHLELFVERPPGGPVRCSFLEVGARVGGAEIPFLWREVHGYDLMEAAFRLQLGERPHPPRLPAAPHGDTTAGWLLIPAPAERPCRIDLVTPMVGRDPGPYAESLLMPGDVLPAADAYYEHVGGRFRFRGRSSAEVEQAIRATAEDFKVTAQPLHPAAV
ncbi:ATP-grasp domain-containing protein [Streptomyces sp. NBC_01262]|uniref:ATP-grasp domain-containing protein n=1 Tax=Streptomyces sp. NBC_01262 TaxID=2903803 RepID=UPI002E3511C7|nr:biotin carboxylase [Streptomyces sp. NBC_01262]